MEIAQRTLRRVEELTNALAISINEKTLFVSDEAGVPWASFAISHKTIPYGFLAVSFDVDADVEGAAQRLSEFIFQKWGHGAADHLQGIVDAP